ncbi:LysM peptidoglycan-binding domain-containing protein [Pseudothauera nasutitermitis]|uniref:LysM peptidoglycan-binding domain-containing protein n=1 Tax=Pseudothauera nasutitermitis TaxID=2565930 RepID=A0A4S4B467_9RHOO|nr:transglycosylase SLT domain-containing protein [Pseudothauera nasutitermitis]THF67472.1 LysM peptidoglycan-binding domain-containing protein [Pseudothauera nasutitermitis]
MHLRFALLCALLLPLSAPLHAGGQPKTVALLSSPPAAVPAAVPADLLPTLPRVLTLDLTRDANDIWDRIRRGFAMPDLEDERVAEYQRFYLERPGFLQQVFARGGRYLYHIVAELEARGLPTELALLPMVESSYNPLAYSRSHASGLWQFIPSTGRHYNLTQDKWIDERRDVLASTDAALEYLQRIYDQHGDWQLALASYNWGEGAVARAVQRNEDAGLPTEYAHLRMPDETRNYIPKLQAVKNIVLQPERFGFELPYVPNRPYFVTVESPVGIDLGAAARLAEMPIDEFIALNPSFNRPAITRSGLSLVVPVSVADRFSERLKELAEAGPGWKTHRLKRGETLEAVARRHRLTLAQLRQLNGLGARARVSAGYALLVPEGVDPRGALSAARIIPDQARNSRPASR